MTGIHHTAPATWLRATRREADTVSHEVRPPSTLLRTVRRVTGRTTPARLPRWVDVTPASAAR